MLPPIREARSSRERSPDLSRRDESTRSRATATPARSAAADRASREPNTRGRATAASSGTIEEGADLTFGRRVPLVRIDSENPYQ